MVRNSVISTLRKSWRYLRWAIAMPALPLVWWACTSHPLAQPNPQPEQQTNIYISISPNRLLDMVFMVDNSPSMTPKQEKLKAQFPKLINALRDPGDQTLPDLRVAIIDSDLGTGGQQPVDSNCGPNARNGQQMYGDMGKFQMIGATGCGVTSPDAKWLEYKSGKAINYNGDINNVFGCLASAVGVAGCGFEHQLQAFEFAFVVGAIGNDIQHNISDSNPNGFLRPSAYLAMVFLSDEDDCSAATNDGMFASSLSSTILGNESASLRCATRGHSCGGRTLTLSPPGYPTDAPFATDYTSCEARTDACSNETDNKSPTDTSQSTDCSPLKSIKSLADHLKSLKANPDEQILVAGIYGVPLNPSDPKTPKYKVAMTPNPSTLDKAHPQVYDYWPICYDPDHQPKQDPNGDNAAFDVDAAGWGATGGLRMDAFINEFGSNGLKFSICQRDYSTSLQQIGDTLAKKLQNLCVDYKLIDTDANIDNGVQADCRVVYKKLDANGNYVEDKNSMPQCDPSQDDDHQPVYDCWKLVKDWTKCDKLGQLIAVVRPKDQRATPQPAGTKVGMQCRTCVDVVGIPPIDGCNYTPPK